MAMAFVALSYCLALRWIVTGTIPMSNGYETMLTLAWIIMLVAMLMRRRFPIMLTFGFLLSGFFLLVSHISQMDPQMTHLMPVLNSPLLTIHVSVIMMAYALLSLTFVSSLTALAMPKKREEMHLLSQLMLFPALTFMGFGIFIGAIWANVSWGTYWSWDPKETWALITFMIYAAPAHRNLKLNYHVYMVLAFLTIIMTYFGVNYFLGGMHSYA
jgi:ABC-type transport system involved in cytochrome c biogenesis permease subunit